MFLSSKSKGFTLIELLVVISIISLLSSVVLASMKEVRNKAKLSAIKESIISFRNEAELFHATNNIYHNGDFQFNEGSMTNCFDSAGITSNTNIRRILTSINTLASTMRDSEAWRCGINNSSYAFSLLIDLPDGNRQLCFDSSGMIKASPTNIDGDLIDLSVSEYFCKTN